ncbi:GPR1/FUN34/yaaH family-domain-containing protein [Aspergillus pseudocaelatus]|uniref:GPR1/FUN34/yaaH family-domain-containing protein n=1 Tax=Aspergillus pseudocaelatus TaxID=1825620 RepID=A0ABQ6WSF0_9EURO|nr:GPR1/FUN34/yaaH family-domain-containing protein [Aspergillus pseudocaelatus]
MSHEVISEKQDASTSEMLRRIQTAESVLLPIPRDAFEKLYLNPKVPTRGNLRRTFGNPTPISLMGFVLAATPAAMSTLGWRGSGGNGGAILPVFIFFGGMVQIFGAVGEWILGNTFSCALFFTYGTFWIVFGTSEMPFYAVGTNYSPTGSSFEGMQTSEFNATVGLYYIVLAVLTFVYLICSIRTNACLFLALFLLVIAFSLFGAGYFQLAAGNPLQAEKLQKVAGGFTFALCIPIWHIFIAQILDAVDFPFSLPVGDLSTIVVGKSQKAQKETCG